MVRRCFPVAKIVGSSPTGVVFLLFYSFDLPIKLCLFLYSRFFPLSELVFLVVEWEYNYQAPPPPPFETCRSSLDANMQRFLGTHLKHEDARRNFLLENGLNQFWISFMHTENSQAKPHQVAIIQPHVCQRIWLKVHETWRLLSFSLSLSQLSMYPRNQNDNSHAMLPLWQTTSPPRFTIIKRNGKKSETHATLLCMLQFPRI